MGRDDSRTGITNVLEESSPFTRQVGGGSFVVVRGPDRGEQVGLGKREISFGSSSSCDLVLSDRTVSRRHLAAVREGDQVILRDLGSTNGSVIQGSRFKEVAIGFGAEIKCGRTVLKFLPEEEALEPVESTSSSFGALVGHARPMRRLFGLLERLDVDLAPDAAVLVEGEAGTGKQLVAEEIHRHSPRRDAPFVVFDCGAAPRELCESALFGHVKGAFSGAAGDRRGAFAEAHGGTLFFDEVGDLPLEIQPALLRALDKKAFRRVGASDHERVDVRIIAATRRDLRAAILQRGFREDLYYRLAAIHLVLPTLRERSGDVPRLVAHFIRELGRTLRLDADDEARLVRHEWPGNVRELRDVVERACLAARGDRLDLDGSLLAGGAGGRSALGVRTDLPYKEAKGRFVEIFEREYVSEIWRRHKMNLSAAAREAQMDRKHLRELIRKYGLDPRAGTAGPPDDE